jgi:hypothetical protein
MSIQKIGLGINACYNECRFAASSPLQAGLMAGVAKDAHELRSLTGCQGKVESSCSEQSRTFRF